MQGIQICHYLAKGLTMKEVGAHLNLSRAVVDERLKNLRRKYNCTTTYQLMGLLGAKGVLKYDATPLSRNAMPDSL